MAYKRTKTDIIIRAKDGAYIPADPANIDYAAYLTWLAAGNTPQPADPVLDPDQSEKINALHEKAVAGESKLSDQDRALWQAQSPVLRALVSFLGIADGRIADIVAIARKLEGG